MLAGEQPVSEGAGSLEVRGLCKSFGGIVATDSVDLSVALTCSRLVLTL